MLKLHVCLFYSTNFHTVAGIDPSKCTAFGPGLGNDVSDTQPTYFTVQSKDCEGKDLNKGGYPFEVKVTGPKGDVPATVTDNGNTC